MAIQNYILLIEAGLLFALAFYVLLRNPSQKVPRAFFVMVFGGALWVLGNAIDYIYELKVLTKLDYVAAILLAIGFVYFSYYFPYQYKRLPKTLHVFMIVMGFILVASLFIGKYFIVNITYGKSISSITFGFLFHVFNVYFLLLWFWGILNFIQKYKIANGLHYWQIKNVFWAISLSLIAGITTNLILPWIFNIWIYGWIGPMFSIIFFGFLSYILFKKEVR